MKALLKDFFRHERSQVFQPRPDFSKRVMARLAVNERAQQERCVQAPAGIWELLPTSILPVFALVLIIFVCLFAIEMSVPHPPERGMVEAYLDPDQPPGERLLYSEAELPDGQELFVEMMELWEQ
jgi:hypothetical protein